MAEDLKSKTKKSLVWNTIDRIGAMAITFVTGIITARLLSPHDFGLIGALAIFSAIGNILIESGFSITLLKRKEISEAEYSAVFFFNIAIGVALYIPFFFCTPLIADFFREEALTNLARVVFLTLLLNPLGIIQNVLLRRELKYMEQAVANIVGLLIAGISAYILIKLDYGYWALAWQQIIFIGCRNICLWILHPCKITFACDFGIIKDLFSASFKIMLNSLFTTIVNNIYNFIVGKKYDMSLLGYFSQAKKYEDILPQVIGGIVGGVGGSSLVKLNNEPERQLTYLRRFVRITSFCLFPVMIYLYLCMSDIVTVILTEKWLPMIPYFQLFCVAGILHPFHSLYFNYYLIAPKGQGMALSLETVKNVLIILSVLLCIFFFPNNIEILIIGYVSVFVIIFITDMFLLNHYIHYSPINQLKDMLPNLLISLVMAVAIVQYQSRFQLGGILQIIVETVIGGSIYLAINLFINKQLLVELVTTFKKKE